ncbi:hypothetical protein Tco_0675123 [Tanacetum coccineum]
MFADDLRVIKAIDEMAIPIDVLDPIEKVNLYATYLNECQVAKVKAKQELGDEKIQLVSGQASYSRLLQQPMKLQFQLM